MLDGGRTLRLIAWGYALVAVECLGLDDWWIMGSVSVGGRERCGGGSVKCDVGRGAVCLSSANGNLYKDTGKCHEGGKGSDNISRVTSPLILPACYIILV